jgi:hypothetical protein
MLAPERNSSTDPVTATKRSNSIQPRQITGIDGHSELMEGRRPDDPWRLMVVVIDGKNLHASLKVYEEQRKWP